MADERFEHRLTWDDKLSCFWFSHGLPVVKENFLKDQWEDSVVFSPTVSQRIRSLPERPSLLQANLAFENVFFRTICDILRGLPVTRPISRLNENSAILSEIQRVGELVQNLDRFVEFLQGRQTERFDESLKFDGLKPEILPSDERALSEYETEGSDWWVDTDDEGDAASTQTQPEPQKNTKPSRGLTNDAFCHCLDSILRTNKQLLENAVAEVESMHLKRDNDAKEINISASFSVLLVKLLSKINPVRKMLQFLAEICWCDPRNTTVTSPSDKNGSHGPKNSPWELFPSGSELLNYVFNLLNQECPQPSHEFHSTLRLLFSATCVPLLRFLQSWLLQDTIHDPFFDFTEPEPAGLCQAFRTLNLPSFLDPVRVDLQAAGPQMAMLCQLADSSLVDQFCALWGPLLFSEPSNGEVPGVSLMHLDVGSLEEAGKLLNAKVNRVLEGLTTDEPGHVSGPQLLQTELHPPGDKKRPKPPSQNQEPSGQSSQSTLVKQSSQVCLVYGLTQQTLQALWESRLSGSEGWPAFRQEWLHLRRVAVAMEGKPHALRWMQGLLPLPPCPAPPGSLGLEDWMDAPVSLGVSLLWVREMRAWCQCLVGLHSRATLSSLRFADHFRCLRSFVLMEDSDWSALFLGQLLPAVWRQGFFSVDKESWARCCSALDKSLANRELPDGGQLWLEPPWVSGDMACSNTLRDIAVKYRTEGPLSLLLTDKLLGKFSEVSGSLLAVKGSLWALSQSRAIVKQVNRRAGVELRVAHSLLHGICRVFTGLLTWTCLELSCVRPVEERLAEEPSGGIGLHVEGYLRDCQRIGFLTKEAEGVKECVDSLAALTLLLYPVFVRLANKKAGAREELVGLHGRYKALLEELFERLDECGEYESVKDHICVSGFVRDLEFWSRQRE